MRPNDGSRDALTLVVLGTLAGDPYAGMAWMHMQIAAGLLRLGHDVTYVEATSAWPYDPVRRARVDDSEYAVPYLSRVAESFGLGDRWAYRRSYSDGAWLGPRGDVAETLLAEADAVFNVAGATRPDEDGLEVGRLVYFGTDPPFAELALAGGDPEMRAILAVHDVAVTYGENIGTDACPVPPLPRLRARTRQPVLTDLWRGTEPVHARYTTVTNWKQLGRDIEFRGETYRWSKHHELLALVDLPRRAPVQLELAMGLDGARAAEPSHREAVPAIGMTAEERRLLDENGWLLTDAHAFTTDPWQYHAYVRGSRAEFSVAKDQNVRLQTGWFSERSACYLAAGRPVVAQDTGFGRVLPTGEGLFAYRTADDALAAFEAIESDYARHSRAAAELAEEYLRAETVLAKLLDDVGPGAA
jgi:hypothetical protein